jgi:hypothetical protein
VTASIQLSAGSGALDIGEPPPRSRYRGELGEEIVVLSTTEIRIAHQSLERSTVDTADGPVTARSGDFVVATSVGDRYPIPAPIFLGTYEILRRFGNWFVGRRLVHRRRAWPVISPGAEFDYGPDRGWVSAQKGSWLYQSDDGDYGLINRDASQQSHTVVCSVVELRATDWIQLTKRLTRVLGLLPPLLAGLAAVAFALQSSHPRLAFSLLLVEASLLVAGVCVALLARVRRWSLRAAVSSEMAVAHAFQVAAEAIGQPASRAFPTMVLWRAAQTETTGSLALSPERMRAIKDQLSATIDRLSERLKDLHRTERVVDAVSWTAAVGIVVVLFVAGLSHTRELKLIAIWIPAVVGACHAWVWARRIGERTSVDSELVRMLQFVRTRLVALAPTDDVAGGSSEAQGELREVLRLLCRCIAGYCQHELRLSASERATVPV